MSASALLFVYGSLRPASGHAMSQWLATRADWQGPAQVTGWLYRISWYPGLVQGEGIVHGDLYRLHDPAITLQELDDYEEIHGNDNDEYLRQLSTVTSPDGKTRQAWVYCYRQEPHQENQINSGDWLNP